MESLLTLARALAPYRFHVTTEKWLQDDLEQVLRSLQYDYRREHRLGSGAVDFYLPVLKLAIECKIKGRSETVHQQILRYAEFEEVEGLLLVTSKSKHCREVEDLAGKPFRRLWVGGNLC